MRKIRAEFAICFVLFYLKRRPFNLYLFLTSRSRSLNYFSREYLTSQTNHLINPYHFISTLLNANFDFDVGVTIDIAKRALPGKVMQRSHCMEVRILTNENECYIMK